MNILYMPAAASTVEMMNRLVKQVEIDNIFILLSPLFEDSDVLNTEFGGKVKHVFHYLDSFYDRYEKDDYFKDAPPLDTRIIEQMAPYEGEILKQLERNTEAFESPEVRFSFYFDYLKNWNYFFEKENIDCVVWGNVVPHECYDQVIYRLAQIKGIPYIGAEKLPFRTKQRVMMIDGYENFEEEIVKKTEELYESGDPIELPEDLEEEYDLFTTVKKRQMPYKPMNENETVARIANLLQQFKERGFSGGIKWVKERITFKRTRKARKNRLNEAYIKLAETVDFSEKYIYFPLQFQPEMTTSPLGGVFVHQYLAIELLSYCVPEDVMIYVKEHPVCFTYPFTSREPFHYDRIRKLRNVRLISSEIDTLELTKNAIAVSAITGSVGYEAMYKLKPFLMFGYQMMRYAPLTYNIRTIDDCKKAMDEITSGKATCDERKVKAFLKVMGEKSFLTDREGFEDWANTELTVSNVTAAYKEKLIKAGAKEIAS